MSRGRAENQMNQLNVHQSSKQTPAGGGKSAVSHTHTRAQLFQHTLIRHRNAWRNGHTHTHTQSHQNRDEPIITRHQCDRERWSEDDGVREVKEYVKALSEKAAVRQTPSHSGTLN